MQITKERDYRADWREAGGRSEVPADLPGTEAPSLVALMRMTPEEWDLWTRGSAIRRAGYPGFRRNVAVAMGNWLAAADEPPEDALAVLREAVEQDEPLVAEHAKWALERVRERVCNGPAPTSAARAREDAPHASSSTPGDDHAPPVRG